MRTKHNELAIGITVTIATLVVVVSILLLGKSSVITVGTRIDMTVQNANGLGSGDNVTFRGITVGSVESVQLKKTGVLAVLKLTSNPDIPANSQFVIREASLLGGRTVDILPGTSKTMLKPDAHVVGHSEPGILSMAEGSTGGVKQKLSKILSNINNLSGEQTTKNIYATLHNLNALTLELQAMLKENRSAVSATLTNLQAATSNANTTVGNINQIATDNKKPIHKVLVSMNQTTLQLEQVIKKTNTTVTRLNTMLTSLQKGKGSLGKLMVDDSLYRQMQSTVSQINALVKDIRQNPKKYVTFKLF